MFIKLVLETNTGNVDKAAFHERSIAVGFKRRWPFIKFECEHYIETVVLSVDPDLNCEEPGCCGLTIGLDRQKVEKQNEQKD